MPAKMKIRSAYASLPSAERKVADFILENPEKASLMVITEIAEASNVSVPSVTRLAKKLGYSGFLDFRVALAAGSSSLDSLKSEPLKADDADPVAVEKVFLACMRALEDTLRGMNKDKLSEVADKIVSAKRIFVLGTTSSSEIASDFALQLASLGYDATAVLAPEVMDMYQSRFTPDDTVVGLSCSGRTKAVIDCLKAAHASGAYCSYASNFVNSPAVQYVDSFFCTCRVDDIKQTLNRESNLAMYALCAALLMLTARKTKKTGA